ncbi:shugoshin-1-like [Cocos nucifera]|uniref:Shugoshin-1-like n=1 Tax=Cocos nucifera TaxID=13894 RepID=A0A8K0N8E8_COCNU|nr:shugoshin-1-like [Cocos nucifera]
MACIGKKLKAMQHVLGCMAAALRTKTLELEEAKTLYKQHKQPHKNINIEFKENKNKLAEFVPDASHLASYQRTCSPHGMRKLRSLSLGTTTITHQVAVKEKNECRRSLRRRSSNLNAEHCEPTEELFEIEDVKFPIRSLSGDPMHEDCSAQLDPSSAQPTSDAIMNPEKVEFQEEKSSSKDWHQGSRRSSLGRPMRRAAEEVSYYKEAPLNVKMRRGV